MTITRSFPLPHFDPLVLHLNLCPEGPGFMESAGLAPRTGRWSIVPLRSTESYLLEEGDLVRRRGGPFDLLRAAFPGGTITGVPKKRCMEIIEEFEPVGRGSYTGSAGYIAATGEMDLNILIRSFQLFGKELTYQAGAGIVADSIPEKEWEEVLAKGESMRKAVAGGQ